MSEPRNVTAEAEVQNSRGNYTQVQKKGFEGASNVGGWVTSLFIIPLGIVWGLARSIAKAALALFGIGLMGLGAWFSVDNVLSLLGFPRLQTCLFNITEGLNFWQLLTAIIIAGTIELWQAQGLEELKSAGAKKRTGGQVDNWKIAKGIVATVVELASLVSGFWTNGGFANPLSWVIIFLAVFGVKTGYAMVSEFMRDFNKNNRTAEA